MTGAAEAGASVASVISTSAMVVCRRFAKRGRSGGQVGVLFSEICDAGGKFGLPSLVVLKSQLPGSVGQSPLWLVIGAGEAAERCWAYYDINHELEASNLLENILSKTNNLFPHDLVKDSFFQERLVNPNPPGNCKSQPPSG